MHDRIRYFESLGIPYYQAAVATAKENRIELVELFDLLRNHGRFHGPSRRPG
jgi:hypothetical protein